MAGGEIITIAGHIAMMREWYVSIVSVTFGSNCDVFVFFNVIMSFYEISFL